MTDAVERVVTAARRARILVVGDVMLDEHVVGTVDRVSPEAPVPIVRAQTTSRSPGGAANVARQVAAFGATADLVGVVGDDPPGEALRDRCRASGIEVAGLVAVAGAITTRKQRVVAGRQQLVRVDWEDEPHPDEAPPAGLLEALAGRPRPDAVIVSDYAKGVVSPAVVAAVTAQARAWAVPVLVDPRPGPFSRYAGATLVKANRAEVEAGIGRPLGVRPEVDLVAPVRRLMVEADVARAVVTLGERGLVVLDSEGAAVPVVQEGREVYDVSGAGDTVIAVLALALVAGEDLVAAARLANRAAGVVVGRAGVTNAWPSDLVGEGAPGGPSDGAITRATLAQRAEAWHRDGRRVVLANGCFDLLHPGHLHLLRQAAAHGDVLVVAVNTDRSVRAVKGEGRPFSNEVERMAMVAALEGVTAVVPLDEDDPAALIDQLRPDVLVKGADYSRDEVVGADAVESWGGEVVLVPLLAGWSTTLVAARTGEPS